MKANPKTGIVVLASFFLIFAALSVFSQTDTAAENMSNTKAHPWRTSYLKYPQNYFQYRYHPERPFALDFGVLGYYWGMYFSYQTAFVSGEHGARNPNDILACNNETVTNGHTFYLFNPNGQSKRERGAVTLGYYHRFHYHWLGYFGTGYGWDIRYSGFEKRYKYTGTSYGNVFARNSQNTVRGIETEAGLLLDLKYFTIGISAGIVNGNTKTFLWAIGIGTPPDFSLLMKNYGKEMKTKN